MNNKKIAFYTILFLGIVSFIFLIMQVFEILFLGNIAMLFPKGIIALRERNLLFIVQALMLIVVIPVYFLTFFFAWKYRASNTKSKYDPEWGSNRVAEAIWWGVPFIIIFVISFLTWVRTVQLDPYRPLESDRKPISIQVIALQWKWLFIYPEEKIAVVNFLQFPVNTPVRFDITAEAPMNSFWIPQLSGQIFAMPKMRTKLHIMANEVGDYRGSSANISGEGFANMHFIARASTDEEYENWVRSIKDSSKNMTMEVYNQLAKPSLFSPVTTFVLKDDHIFEQIIQKYLPAQRKMELM